MFRNLVPGIRRRGDLPLWRAEDHPFFNLQREMNQMFDDFFRGFDLVPFGGRRGLGTFSPSIDVREGEKEITIKAELPGLDEKDVEVTLTDDALTIRGEKKDEKEEKGKDYWHRETSYGSFHRVIPLPKGLSHEKADAHFKKGILTITLPRLEEAKVQGKKIAVKTE